MQRFRNILMKIELLFLLVIVCQSAGDRVLHYVDTATAACFVDYRQVTEAGLDETQEDTQRQEVLNKKKVALTFDDDVIIGLSQDDCCK